MTKKATLAIAAAILLVGAGLWAFTSASGQGVPCAKIEMTGCPGAGQCSLAKGGPNCGQICAGCACENCSRENCPCENCPCKCDCGDSCSCEKQACGCCACANCCSDCCKCEKCTCPCCKKSAAGCAEASASAGCGGCGQ